MESKMTKQTGRLVVVDDEQNILAAIKVALRKLDIEVAYFDLPCEALEYIKNNKPNMVISDQRMPKMLGTELLAKVKALYPGVIGVLLTAYNDFEDVSHAFNKNVIQKYLAKPWDNKELVHLVEKSMGLNSWVTKNKSKSNDLFHGMLSKDISMAKTFEQIRKASMSNIPIFITGETGTGKELVAKACHLESSRKSENFIAVNCANFSESLMESQLFGHVKGAFTGAVSHQEGLLAASNKGTLFLDEVTCLPLPLQAKLLRVLQEKEFCAIGSTKVKKFGGQIITASSLTLSKAVRLGEFREDLFYRLNVITIQLPRLKERGKDVLLLAKHFLALFSEVTGKIFEGFSTAAKIRLSCYHWPGNIRQLENLIHSLVVLNDGVEINDAMLKQGLPTSFLEPVETTQSVDCESKDFRCEVVIPLWESEKEIIQKAIDRYNGNIPRASAALEISPSTVYRKIQIWKEMSRTKSIPN